MPILIALVGLCAGLLLVAVTVAVALALGLAVGAVQFFLLVAGGFTVLCIAGYYVIAGLSTIAPAGLYLWALLAALVPFASAAALTTVINAPPLAALLAFLLGLLLLMPVLLVNGLTVLVAYIVGSLFMGPPANAPTPSAGELVARWFMIGLNAALNLALAALVYPAAFGLVLPFWPAFWAGLAVAVALAIIALLGVFSPANPVSKLLIGWTVFLMPSAWPVVFVGAAFFFLSHLLHLVAVPFGVPFITIVSNTLIGATGSVSTIGGLCANLNLIRTAYNLGTFTLVASPAAAGAPPLGIMVTHERGHQLSLGAFGHAFHYIGFIDETVQGVLGLVGLSPGGASVYSERLAEGHVAVGVSAPRPRLIMWQAT
jgi:hypothetical protein